MHELLVTGAFTSIIVYLSPSCYHTFSLLLPLSDFPSTSSYLPENTENTLLPTEARRLTTTMMRVKKKACWEMESHLNNLMHACLHQRDFFFFGDVLKCHLLIKSLYTTGLLCLGDKSCRGKMNSIKGPEQLPVVGGCSLSLSLHHYFQDSGYRAPLYLPPFPSDVKV